MKIIIPNVSLSAVDAMRRCGYGFERRHENGELSASRKVGGGDFPRYHMYAKMLGDSGSIYNKSRDLQITLHIDQKAPSYKGSRMHSGEYEGPLLDEEAQRVQDILSRS